jgi:hypothetical protein
MSFQHGMLVQPTLLQTLLPLLLTYSSQVQSVQTTVVIFLSKISQISVEKRERIAQTAWIHSPFPYTAYLHGYNCGSWE